MSQHRSDQRRQRSRRWRGPRRGPAAAQPARRPSGRTWRRPARGPCARDEQICRTHRSPAAWTALRGRPRHHGHRLMRRCLCPIVGRMPARSALAVPQFLVPYRSSERPAHCLFLRATFRNHFSEPPRRRRRRSRLLPVPTARPLEQPTTSSLRPPRWWRPAWIGTAPWLLPFARPSHTTSSRLAVLGQRALHSGSTAGHGDGAGGG